MKTKTSLLFKGIIAAMLVVIFAACGSSDPTPAQVAQSISNGSQLSQKDYAAMIDYCGKYADEAQKYFNTINAQPNDSTAESIAATSALADLYGKYTYLDQFRDCLSNTDYSALDDANKQKVEKYGKLEGFPLPVGAVFSLDNPKVVGDIEQMPATDSTSEVSQGDGEAVNVNVAD